MSKSVFSKPEQSRHTLPRLLLTARHAMFLELMLLCLITENAVARLKPTLMVKPCCETQKARTDTTKGSQTDTKKGKINLDQSKSNEESVFHGLNTITMLRKWRKREN